MPQDAFSLYHTARELNTILKGAKINRVSQPDKDDLYLLTHSFSGNRTLVLSSNAENCRIAFVKEEKPNPKSALGFCMLCRKHLLGTTIESIELVGFERIVKITFSGRNDFKENVKKVLYAEIMGKYSNIILADSSKKILAVLKPVDFSVEQMQKASEQFAKLSEVFSKLKEFAGEEVLEIKEQSLWYL